MFKLKFLKLISLRLKYINDYIIGNRIIIKWKLININMGFEGININSIYKLRKTNNNEYKQRNKSNYNKYN